MSPARSNHSSDRDEQALAASLHKTLGRIGDAAAPEPSWASLVERYAGPDPGGRRSFGWISMLSPTGRLAGVVVAVFVAAAVGGLLLSALLPSDGVNVESVDEAPQTDTTVPTPTSDRSDIDEGAQARTVGPQDADTGCISDLDPDGLAAGSGWALADTDADGIADRLVPTPRSGSRADNSEWGQADIDGDGFIDRITTVIGDAAVSAGTQIVVALGTGQWIVSNVDVFDGEELSFNPPWSHVDLDGDGGDELLGEIAANNFSRVMVFDLVDCSVEPVPLEPPEQFADGFPAYGSSESCRDTCNVGLACLPSGNLLAFESSELDRADRYGLHQWSSTEWELDDGVLTMAAERSGELPWSEMSQIGPPNVVTCTADEAATEAEPESVNQEHLDDAAALAERLGVDTLLATTCVVDRHAKQQMGRWPNARRQQCAHPMPGGFWIWLGRDPSNIAKRLDKTRPTRRRRLGT